MSLAGSTSCGAIARGAAARRSPGHGAHSPAKWAAGLRPHGAGALAARVAAAGAPALGGRGGRGGTLGLQVSARQTRLAEVVQRVPSNVDRYFNNPRRKKQRRALWKVTSAVGGYYFGNMVTLAFGTLGVNDVIAGAVMVWVCEVITKAYWTRRSGERGLYLQFANLAKMGFTAALISDAFKLGS